MKKRLLPLTVAILLAYPGLGLAAGDDHNGSGNGESSQTSEMSNMSPEDHLKMQTDPHNANPSEHHGTSTDSHSSGVDTHGSDTVEHGTTDSHSSGTHGSEVGTDSHGSGSAGGEHGHGKPVVETPPNFKILGAFAAVNAGFLLIGVWNKFFRRRAA